MPPIVHNSDLTQTFPERSLQTGPVQVLHKLLEAQAPKNPEAVAVVFDNHHLTYGEFDARANQMARHLQSLGVHRGDLVGIFAERSLELVLALYGTLKAGAAYVPIDPSYPGERVTFMLQDSQVRVLLTQAHLRQRIPTYEGRVVVLENDRVLIDRYSRAVLNGHERPDDLAYMIYTSGSTGQPKGAMNTHRGVCNRLLWMQAAYHLKSDDRVLQKTPFSFDVSVWEFFWPLLTGARLILALPDGQRDSSYLRELIQREGITTLHFVPSMLRIFLQEPAVEACGKLLRRVISSGEVLSVNLQALFFSRLPSSDLHNLYGPTESAVDVTAWTCQPDFIGATVPIGRPISHIQIYILDAAHRPVPVEVSGELYIGGVGVARGYHRRPDLTAEKFTPDPEGPHPGARLYQTGDLAKYHGDGTLEYLGRVDHQIKIRGFRIECGEIESAFRTHQAVQEAVVVAKEDGSHRLRLVAYVVLGKDCTATTSELLMYVKRFLPDYMLPSRIIPLAMFPSTPNGKIDRKALPAPDFQRPQLESSFVAPTTKAEMDLAKIWSQILEVTPVGIHDSFFDLGGDSILALQVVAFVQQQDLPLTLEQLYTEQTIHNLVMQMNETQLCIPRLEVSGAPFSLLSKEDQRQLPKGLENAYPLTSLQTGMFFHNEKNPASAIFHDIFSFRITAQFDYEILQAGVDRFIQRHDPMRTSFDLGTFSKPLQLVYPSARLDIAVEDLCHLDEAARSEVLTTWIETEKTRPFDSGRAPLLRIMVHRYSTNEFQLSVSFHHAVLDGWSLALMLTEILQDYSAALRRAPSPITSPAIPYQTYVALEEAAFEAEHSRKFWIEKLHNPDIHLLPRWPGSSGTGRSEQIRGPELSIPGDIFDRLTQLTSRAKTPLKSALLTAHFRVMNALHGRPDVMSGIITHGRPETVDGARMIGLFLNTLPLRLRLSGGTWLDLVQQVFRAECELIPHRRFPLAAIQQALGGETLFETAFDFVHWHVYRNLERDKDLGFSEGPYFEANNFILFTTFILDSGGTQLAMHIDYDPTQLEAKQIEAINGYYLNTLTSMAFQPEARYEHFSLLDGEERLQQLAVWNDADQPYSFAKGLHQFFEEQVTRTPDTIAVRDGMHAISYFHLNRQANRLAHLLKGMGVGPDVPVAVCLNRTADMLVALMAIFKAGGAYVPLDPAYPSSWLETVLRDTQAPLLLTQERWLSHLPIQGQQIIVLDERERFFMEDIPLANPANPVHPEQLAYVLYTSGSTGQPKGVAITLRSVTALMSWGQKAYPPKELAGVLACTSICFDLSVFEIFLPLSWGGTVILAENALALPTLPAASEVTLINSVPSVVKELLHTQRLPLSVRVINLAGEPLRTALVKQLYAEPGIQKVYDLYGPSETTTYSTMALREAEGPETIGRPISYEQVYVLEDAQRLLPVGVVGELLIGGTGIARGYYRRPALTAEKFIPNGLSPYPGTRLYRTGDQGRYRQDGQIEYLGRLDHQVKVRGFRIELGQIEAKLHGHPDIEQAVVICYEDGPEEKILAAYVVPKNGFPIEPSAMRSYLSAQLPAHMIPGTFVVLNALPLMANGKVDRKALPAPHRGQRAENRPVVIPRTPQEIMIAGIWRDLLQVDQVGVHDNFFEMGGHSLLATRLISRIQYQSRLEISLEDFFEKPTVAGLGEKLCLLRNGTNRMTLPSLQPVSRSLPLPLSFSQQQLWLVEKIQSGGTAYILPYAWRVTGALRVEILERSLNALIQRHESLRMYVVELEGEPRQAFHPQLTLTLPIIDLQMIPQSEQERVCQAHIREAEAHPFDLQQGPLIRVALYRLAPEDYLLVLTLHHIVTDGWSMDILFSELRQFYEAFGQGQSPNLPPLPIQYADYAIWQRTCLQGETLKNLLTYWTNRLADAPAKFVLPTDYSRPGIQTFRGGNLTRRLEHEKFQTLKNFCQEEGVTLFMALLAVLQALLARHSGQKDIVVGTPVANRNHIELERSVGIFLNTLVLRTDLSGAPTFRELLRLVREVCSGAFAHQDLPFEKLVETLHPVRDLSRTPLFQVFFNLVDVTERRLTLPEVTLQPVTNHEESSAKFDLTLYVFITDHRAWVTWNYNSDLFAPTTIAWLFDHFETLLDGLLSQPDVPVSTVPIAGQTKRSSAHLTLPVIIPAHPLFRPFEYFENTLTLPGRFEQMAAHHSQHIAVHTSEGSWTYAELNRRANRVAHTLLDVLPDSAGPQPMGLLCSTGRAMLAGLLGVLKAGHPYVPLEPTFPLERLETIAGNATLTTILCSPDCLDRIPSWRERGYRIIPIDEAHLAQEETNPQISLSPDALAYILYTSGTTGVPKGVIQTHRNVLHHIGVYTNNLKIGSDDRLTQLASFSFDAAVMDIFGALLNGAALYPLNLQEADPEEISLWLVQQAITLYHSTPTVYRYWLKHLPPNMIFPALRLVVLGGEECTRADFEGYQKHFGPECFFVNGLGPTESTLSLQFVASHSTGFSGQTVPVGFPVQNTEVVLLDDNGQSTDIYGEIVLSSPYVALGYWQCPELTQYAFTGPLNPDGVTQYRTGDLGRYRPDGALEFSGRKDSQIKLRGFRIELGEIVSLLEQHSSVQNAVVLCREDIPDDKQLVAYIAPVVGGKLDPARLRTYLQAKLPDYMLPSAFVVLETLPLTPNGKINRRALPKPDEIHRVRTTDYHPPRTPLEEILMEIWSDLLKVDRIGVHDHFFELGGHSLLATQMVARVRAILGTDMSLRTLFENPTIAQLGSALKAGGPQPIALPDRPLLPMGRPGPFPLSFAQQRLWFLEQWEPGNTAYVLSYAWRLRGPLDCPALEAAMTALVARHESLRTACSVVDERPVQVIKAPAAVALPILNLTELPEALREDEVQRLIQEDALHPFDLNVSPLWRTQLLRVSPEDHVFLLTLHHLITDGWSMELLFQELNALYAAQVTGESTTLPALPMQYTDYAVWQRNCLKGEALDRQMAYWRTQLAEAPHSLDLPTDFPRPPQLSYQGNSVSFMLTPSLTHALNYLSHQEGVTLFMTMLAAFQVLLFRYTSQQDILIGSPIAGRTHPDVEGIVGFFVNTLVLRTRFNGQPTFHEVLHQVKDTCLNAYTHQDLPFEKLVEVLQPVRDPSRHTVFQVMFQLQHAEATNDLKLQNLNILPLPQVRQTAKFDLSLGMVFRDNTLHGTVIFNTDLFEAERISRLTTHFQTLLEGIVNNPRCPVSQLPLLPEAERRQLLVAWNPTLVRNESFSSIHGLFEAQAAQTPDAVAVVDDDEHLTYRSLHSLANQLARLLQQHGVGPEVMVGLYLDKSPELFVGLLGTLKAGAAYVPLDPHSPIDRIAHMIDQANLTIILLRDRPRTTNVFPNSCQTIYLDEILPDLLTPLEQDFCVPMVPSMMAYMIFTSGTTGIPKGIVVSHSNLLNAFQAWDQTYHLRTRHIKHLQMAHMTFDVFTGDFVRAFGSGGTLILCPRETLLDPQKLYDLMETKQVVCAEFVPGVVKYLLDFVEKTHNTLSFFHLFIVGSDVLEQTDFLRLRQVCSAGTRVINSYGLTEATIDSSFFEDLNDDLPQTGSVPVGRPMPNTHLYVLDGGKQPVPIGVTGEVHVGGEGLSRGYWGRPDLTAERFLPHPISQESGARLYRTGDLGYYYPDGNLQLRGRADHQVKIRGFRVELGDIEAALQEHPTVQETVVLCLENENSEKNQLVAYVEGSEPQALFSDVLREFLRGKLPAYMIPAAIIPLDKFPRLPSGKINRKALLCLSPVSPTSDMVGRGPETPVEESLVSIWKELLDLPRVNVRDNFFQLGGHSLLATRLLAKLRETWQSDFPLRILFDHPILEDQAVVLEEHLLKEIEELSDEDLSKMLNTHPSP